MKKVLLLLLFSFALLGTNGHGDGSADHFSAKALVK